MPMINIKGTDFYYELHGKGEPLVMLAGYTCNHQLFSSIADRLSTNFQVLIFDNRAVGQTKDQQQELSVEVMARDTIELIRVLGLEKPHIIGHSMGGTIAQVIAAYYGAEINKLVLLATAAKWREAMLRGLYSSLLLQKMNLDFDTIFTCNLPWVFGENFLLDSEKIKLLKESIVNNPHPQSLTDQERQYNVLRTWDGRSLLSSIHAPTLIGYGIQDLIALPSDSHYLATHIMDKQIVEFDCGHVMPLEIPDELVRAILDFCKN